MFIKPSLNKPSTILIVLLVRASSVNIFPSTSCKSSGGRSRSSGRRVVDFNSASSAAIVLIPHSTCLWLMIGGDSSRRWFKVKEPL
ncbi:hypothetical protein RchiOBHm_Chr7g0193141 [Rosa chinensis]|uniref:Secreted protein n=1 Tax=Rosa chinensis TaxID=74649 RepID=A0A2P6P5S1_ROSCH|nr:hypothetical protein RchiOBHm_Chr7g0193141 [Rosa chinensis]